MSNEQIPFSMNFQNALNALKSGHKVARTGWNGKGQYVYYVPPNRYKAQTEVAKQEFGEEVPYRGYFALKTAQDDVAVWTPSTSDLLAEDWEIL